MKPEMTQLLPDSFAPAPLLTIIERLLDSRVDTIGIKTKPQSLVETFWLNELELAWRKIGMIERRKIMGVS